MSNQKIENCRILITGGAGFIGSNLVERFLAQNNEVVVLDNFLTGKRENLTPFAKFGNFCLIEGDIRDLATCRQAVAGADYVLHEAALGSVPRSIKDPVTSTEINISGFVNVLFAAYEAKVKRFVYAASSSVYGDSQAPVKTEDNLGKPLSPYAITKLVNELYAENFSKIYGIETVGLRYFNVFGRRQDPEGVYAAVIPRFVKDIINHQSPVINGDGEYSRDFTYIDNVIQANELAMLSTRPEALNQVYNIACGERTTLNGLFALLRQNLAKFDPAAAAVEPEYGPTRAGDIPHSLADIAKARTLLGYEPKFDIRAGVEAAAAWYFDHLK